LNPEADAVIGFRVITTQYDGQPVTNNRIQHHIEDSRGDDVSLGDTPGRLERFSVVPRLTRYYLLLFPEIA
jgi:hypothetical protein